MTWMFTESDAVLLSLGQVTVTVTGTVPVCIGAVQSVCRSAGLARAPVGTFQLPPKPTKNPFFDCAVTAIVARVRFSVFDTTGDTVPSVPTMLVPERIVVVSCDGIDPFNSAVTRMKLRDGNPMPVP